MEPNIIFKEMLTIAGVNGDGRETGKIWRAYEDLENKSPINNRVDEVGYEVRMYSGDGQCECHVGICVNNEDMSQKYETMQIPPFMYAVFEVHPALGYDSEDETILQWLNANKEVFKQGTLGDKDFTVVVYNDKFKGGDDPESIVEVWVPLTTELICQSCSMPLSSNSLENIGTNRDGSTNKDYCIHCYKDGAFTVEATMDEMIEMCIPYTSNNNPWPDKETARNTMKKIFPKLKRWKESNKRGRLE